jgi:anthranilate 1,2-dioxygenase small subunit
MGAWRNMDGHKADSLLQSIRDFYERYTQCLDDSDFDKWSTFFTNDAYYCIISRENYDRKLPMGSMTCEGLGMIKDRVTALVKVLVYEPRYWRRFVSSVRIRSIEGDVIHAGANFLLYESMLDREPQLNMLGQYYDTLVRDGDSFIIKERACVYDNHRILTTLFAPV